MTRSALRPCIVCGTPAPGSRCPLHATGWSSVDSRASASYGSEWRRLRRTVLSEEPFCRGCGGEATDVDHILNRARGGSDERSNLQPLCHPCHARKTADEGRLARSEALALRAAL